jgi:serine/threonine protein kinase
VPTRPREVFSATSATTRATESLQGFARQAQYLLVPKQVITSPESSLQYRIERLLGQGGFGQVFLASRQGRSDRVPDIVCIKVSSRIDGWLREAYFGELLDGHPRAIRVYDAFPLFGHGQVLYCLAMEYAAHGDLSAHLERSGKGFSELTARREIAGILQVLDKLHRGQMLHRDLTPVNVFVCDNRRLKLGDFGIARQQSDQRGITARTLNAFTAPSDIINGAVPKWRARDDVYQVGQLLGMLIKGSAKARLRARDVRHLTCSDHLKEIIYRCIGERRKRYESAEELIEALSTPPVSLRSGVLRTLKGAHLAFTGVLSKTRDVAARAAKRAGAVVHGHPSAKTTVVVRGRPNPLQAAGRDGGRKLMEIKRLREKGHRITILNEQQFWKLVDRKP